MIDDYDICNNGLKKPNVIVLKGVFSTADNALSRIISHLFMCAQQAQWSIQPVEQKMPKLSIMLACIIKSKATNWWSLQI